MYSGLMAGVPCLAPHLPCMTVRLGGRSFPECPMPPIADILLFAVMLAAAGAVAGLLAGVFGIGGGAVLVPVFYQVFGYAGIPEEVIMHLAVGTSTANGMSVPCASVSSVPGTSTVRPIRAADCSTWLEPLWASSD